MKNNAIKILIAGIISLLLLNGLSPISSEDILSNDMGYLEPFDYDIFVDDNADPSWYDATHVRTIQEGINNATVGNSIFVYNGTYYENIEINKIINLIGEDKNITFIDGNNSGNTVNISADEIHISHFTIRNGSDFGISIKYYSNNTINNCNIQSNYWIGINLYTSSDNKIELCNITENEIGIYLYDSSNNNTLKNLNISNNHGMYARGVVIEKHSNNNKIEKCIITDNDYPELGDGIGVLLDSNSTHNIVTNSSLFNNGEGYYNTNILLDREANYNTIKNCTIYYKGDDGIGITIGSMTTSHYNIILDCTIYDCGDGIASLSGTHNSFVGCNITKTNLGIYFTHTSIDNTISGCTFTQINETGVYIHSNSNNNSIFHNYFINNTQNAYDECNNTWDNDYPSGGNYWDDYDGEDLDGDGIGDIPYNISGGDNQDRYPLGYFESDTIPPTIKITQPDRALYINGRRIIKLSTTLIIGSIDVEVNASDESGIKEVKFYLDGQLKKTVNNTPYKWSLNEKLFLGHVIKAEAYDNYGNKAEDSEAFFIMSGLPDLRFGTLKGGVVGGAFNLSIPGVKVTATSESTNKTTYTGRIPLINRGKFTLRLPPDTYYIEIEKEGFVTQGKNVTVFLDDNDYLEFYMEKE